MFPITVCDNFLNSPDRIVEYANRLEFFKTPDGRWPGSRTNDLKDIDESLYHYISDKILKVFYPSENVMYKFEMNFQKIKPFHKEKYHVQNRGWIHKDVGCVFGGIIYLNQNPESDTGTSIYEDIADYPTIMPTPCRKKLYLGQPFSDSDYSDEYNELHSKFKESVTVENVYNRLLLFDSKTPHGVKTFGSGENERLTLVFFCTAICAENLYPTLRV
ncbi:hypothetical protein [Synechococcus phage S-H25]|nr:hypothetical protein [Synechococcus phage S-H25]